MFLKGDIQSLSRKAEKVEGILSVVQPETNTSRDYPATLDIKAGSHTAVATFSPSPLVDLPRGRYVVDFSDDHVRFDFQLPLR